MLNLHPDTPAGRESLGEGCPLLIVGGGHGHHDEVMRSIGFGVERVNCAADAVTWLQINSGAIVLIDRRLPDGSGVELCRRIRAAGDDIHAYLILRDRAEQHCGADDYLAPWAPADQLLHRLAAARRIVQLERVVRSESDTMRRLRIIDHVTGVYNERHLQRELPREVRRARQHRRRLALLTCGIRDAGHQDLLSSVYGAERLRLFTDLLVHNVRTHVDYIARMTGSLFAVVLPETGMAGAQITRLRLQEHIAQVSSLPNSWLQRLQVSCGVAELGEEQGDELVVAQRLLSSAISDLSQQPVAVRLTA